MAILLKKLVLQKHLKVYKHFMVFKIFEISLQKYGKFTEFVFIIEF